MNGREEESGYGWVVVLVAAIGAGIGLLGLPLLTLGVFVKPLSHDFGWTRAQIAGASVCVNLATATAAPFIGRLCDKIGVRVIAMASLAGLSLGFLGLTQLNGSLYGYYGVWLFLAFSGVGTTGIIWSRAVSTWFDRRRGLALGVTLSGIGVTTLFGPPIIASVIVKYGWRFGYLGLAVVAALAIPLAYFFFYERGEQAPEERRRDPALVLGCNRREAVRTLRFWLMGAGFLLVVMGFGALLVHLVPLAMDAGVPPVVSAKLFSLIGISMILGRVGIGTLLDRYSPALVALGVLWIPALACWLLIEGPSVYWMIGTAAFFIGFVMGAESDMIPYLVSRYFGMKAFGEIYGCQLIFFAIGSGTGSVLAGWSRDVMGSYRPALYVGIAIFVLGALLVGSIGRVPDFGRAEEARRSDAGKLPVTP